MFALAVFSKREFRSFRDWTTRGLRRRRHTAVRVGTRRRNDRSFLNVVVVVVVDRFRRGERGVSLSHTFSKTRKTCFFDVDIVIDGGFGLNEPSTIIDYTGKQAHLLRQGLGEIDLID